MIARAGPIAAATGAGAGDETEGNAHMRVLMVIGIVLVLAGTYVLVHGITYTTQRSVLQLGEFEASFQEERSVPTWLGLAAVAGGVGLVVTSLRRPPRRTA